MESGQTIAMSTTSIDPLQRTNSLDQKGMGITSAKSDGKMTKYQIIKNVLVVSVGFMLLFTSFQSLTNLQSSLNKEDGLGTGGLSVVYGALIISCMFIPSFTIAHLGCKWTVTLSMVCYIAYMAANFYAVWGLMAPASVIVGLGAAPLWAAKCTYLTQTGVWYSQITGATEDDIINRFFGFFFMSFQTSQIWGNLISSTVFSSHDENVTMDVSPEALSKCGAGFCPGSDVNNTNLERPPIEKVYTVCGIYLACACLAFFMIVFFLDKIQLDKDESRQGKVSMKLLVETFRHLYNSHYQKLLIPLTLYSGIEQAFIAGDFTKSYISCTLGIWSVGYVMICYGVTDAVCSFTFGRLVQYFGHATFFVLAFIAHGSVQITMLLWTPDPERVYIFYILAAVWGMGDAVIQTQINALYGFLFKDHSEAAFSNYRLWESIGFIIAFACSNYMCTDIKLYVCIGILCVGMSMYGVVEVKSRRSMTSQGLQTKL
ncbi:hypothetical protein ScPMuIL_001471 [Solemya velum]